MKRQIVLTVSESKRLIAKGVAAMDIVQRARREGMLVICTGTTNSYLVEEILGTPIDKRAYRSGIITPANRNGRDSTPPVRIPDIVFRNGEIDKGLDRFTAVPHMGKGDVFIKGGNALDYGRRMAGILIIGRDSGTIGNAIGRIVAGRVHLIIPIGLEKLVYEDIVTLSQKAASLDAEGPTLFPVAGTIVTEIEALNRLTGAEATLLASGGVAGAEGAVRLLVEGTDAQVEAALQLAGQIEGEPGYPL